MDWNEALTEMERRIDAARRVLDEGGPAPVPFARPEGLGPLPVHLAPRARQVLRDTQQVMAEVQESRDRLVAVGRRVEAQIGRSAYVDTRA